MFQHTNFSTSSPRPIYLQIADAIRKEIDKGILPKGYVLPSINNFSKDYSVARDTIERAYKVLRKEGYINSVRSKGYFVSEKKKAGLKVLLIFNKLSSFKKIVYYSFLEALGKKATIHLAVHHYSLSLFEEIIEANKGKYDYYVVMPHFEEGVTTAQICQALNEIPETELLLLDKNIPEIKGSMSVYQDFKQDIYEALTNVKKKLAKYKTITLVFPDLSNHPVELIQGVKLFCKENKKGFKILSRPQAAKLEKGQAYILIEDDDLAILIKKMRSVNLVAGKNIGIISFNETPLKDLLDITVFTTDFAKMGATAAQLISQKKYQQEKNPFLVIERASL
jgi:DNA-binding transcriptional regulator YhcF (GntR family)